MPRPPVPIPPVLSLPLGDDGGAQPLQGLTVLAVEDSRYASDALRLLCRRAGARLRRAETLAQARAHLRTYRPDVLLVDLGLPDGSGAALINEVAQGAQRPAVVLGISGLGTGRRAALAAGADGYLEKPVESLAAFCAAILHHLPDRHGAAAPEGGDAVQADPLALADDLRRAIRFLDAPDHPRGRYVAGFVAGLARQVHDGALAEAAQAAAQGSAAGLSVLRGLIAHRLAGAGPAFPGPSTG